MQHERYMRAALLYNQHRFADAERELRDLLSGDPDQPEALRLLGETFLALDRIGEARSTAQQVLGLWPYHAEVHGLLARIELLDDNPALAEKHALEAVQLEPGESSHHGTLAFVLLRRNEHLRALEAADRGLAIDPEDLRCLNMRTEALARLGRKEEADRTIDKSLELDPENPYTHSNTGWAVLRRGDHRKAMEHFREALRRDPMNDHAKAGMVEALKARYWIYRMWLRYSFWVSNLKGNVQLFLIIGLYVANQVLRGVASEYPAVAPLIYPLLIAYAVFAISTWILVPISNLFLRLNKYGRYALDREETLSSTWTGVSLLVSIIGFIAFFITWLPGFLATGILGFVMMIPLASMLGGKKRSRALLKGATVFLAVVGGFAVALTFHTGELVNAFTNVFLVGLLLYQFGANFARIRG
ncbi:MAG: tetratricopeptide repeat protein [Flavobacteriales bacterium]